MSDLGLAAVIRVDVPLNSRALAAAAAIAAPGARKRERGDDHAYRGVSPPAVASMGFTLLSHDGGQRAGRPGDRSSHRFGDRAANFTGSLPEDRITQMV
jgi:hypothetical protein